MSLFKGLFSCKSGSGGKSYSKRYGPPLSFEEANRFLKEKEREIDKVEFRNSAEDIAPLHKPTANNDSKVVSDKRKSKKSKNAFYGNNSPDLREPLLAKKSESLPDINGSRAKEIRRKQSVKPKEPSNKGIQSIPGKAIKKSESLSDIGEIKKPRRNNSFKKAVQSKLDLVPELAEPLLLKYSELDPDNDNQTGEKKPGQKNLNFSGNLDESPVPVHKRPESENGSKKKSSRKKSKKKVTISENLPTTRKPTSTPGIRNSINENNNVSQ